MKDYAKSIRSPWKITKNHPHIISLNLFSLEYKIKKRKVDIHYARIALDKDWLFN
jgi:hypothetical protein